MLSNCRAFPWVMARMISSGFMEDSIILAVEAPHPGYADQLDKELFFRHIEKAIQDMGIFPDMQIGLQNALFQVLDPGIRIQADLQFIPYSSYVDMQDGGRFVYKVSSQIGDHSPRK